MLAKFTCNSDPAMVRPDRLERSSAFKMNAAKMVGSSSMKASLHRSSTMYPFGIPTAEARKEALSTTPDFCIFPLQSPAPQHQRPSPRMVYVPMPAAGSTIKVVHKNIQRRQTLISLFKEQEAALLADPSLLNSPSNSVRFLDSSQNTAGQKDSQMLIGGGEGFISQDVRGGRPRRVSGEISIETPRARWRRQYWSKSTPFGTDRRTYGGMHFYDTGIKPVSKYYNKSSRWENASTFVPPVDSEEVIRQIVYKLEQHCNSMFALTHAFKMFDKDMSNSIDKDEMRAVLMTFSIDISDEAIETLMNDFGAVDTGDGLGKTIKYQDFVVACETVSSQHPFNINTGRFVSDLKARYLEDENGRRLCTPGSKAPVGCPISGCYFPPINALPARSGRQTAMW